MPTTPIFDLRTLEGAKIHASAIYKKLKLLEKQKKQHYLKGGRRKIAR